MRRATPATFDALKKFVSSATNTKGFDRVYDQIRIVSGGEGKLHAELDITAEMLNRNGSLHGGFTCLLVDVASTYALTTVADGKAGVSTDLNVSFFRPVFENDTIVIQADILKTGKSLAFGTVDIINKKNGALIAQGRHTKFLSDSRRPKDTSESNLPG